MVDSQPNLVSGVIEGDTRKLSGVHQRASRGRFRCSARTIGLLTIILMIQFRLAPLKPHGSPRAAETASAITGKQWFLTSRETIPGDADSLHPTSELCRNALSSYSPRCCG